MTACLEQSILKKEHFDEADCSSVDSFDQKLSEIGNRTEKVSNPFRNKSNLEESEIARQDANFEDLIAQKKWRFLVEKSSVKVIALKSKIWFDAADRVVKFQTKVDRFTRFFFKWKFESEEIEGANRRHLCAGRRGRQRRHLRTQADRIQH